MQVVNRKERTHAKWRFAGLYILSLAIPALIILNGVEMGKVEQKEDERLVEQLRKRDEALAELSQLANTLHEAQRLKPAFAQDPEDQAKYDQLRYSFEHGIDRMKMLFYSDTTLYRANQNILSFLEANYKSYNKISGEFRDQVNKEVAKNAPYSGAPSGGGGGGGSAAQVMILERELAKAEKTISRLETQLSNSPKPNGNNTELTRVREQAMAVEANIDQIVDVLNGIEEDCNGIQKKSDNNLKAKNKIIERVKFLKTHVAGIKVNNNALLGMIKQD